MIEPVLHTFRTYEIILDDVAQTFPETVLELTLSFYSIILKNKDKS